MHNRRITPEMTVRDGLLALSEGNPGATRVLIEAMKTHIATWLDLDKAGIYGPAIWELYKDACGEDMVRFQFAATALAEAHDV